MKSIPLTENELKHIRETYELELERLQKRTGEISGILKKLKGIATEDIQEEEEKTTKETLKSTRNASPKKDTKIEGLSAKVAEKAKGKRGRPAKVKAEPQIAAIEDSKDTDAAPKAKRGRKPKGALETKQEIKTPKASKASVPVKKKTEAKPVKPKKTASKVDKTAVPKKRGRKPSENSKKARWTASILDILNEKGKVLPSKEIINQVMKIQDIPAAELQKTRSIITGSLSDLKLGTKKIKTISVPGQKGERYGLSQWFNELGQLIDPSRL